MTPNDIILALAVNLAEVIAERQQLRIENEQMKKRLIELTSKEVIDERN